MIETGNLFTKTLSKEIEDIIEFQPFFDNTVTTNPCSKDGLIHIELGIIEIRRTCTDSYTFDRCTLQLKVYSENYHIVRVFDDDDYERAMFMAKEIEQFNNGTLEQFDIVVEFLEMEFKWVDGKKMGKGTISDFTWPRPNELIFDEHIDIEWRYVDKKDLPLISEKFIPAEEFHVGSNPHCG